ncbi:ATP-binding cassette domain-containing protein, partial [Achromobacter insuavis]|uniref:ATP-binding cassette domain-containing protein n=1 Tax=Achromobacter insuavis TaxID=1287735 RepID=UPI00359F1C89
MRPVEPPFAALAGAAADSAGAGTDSANATADAGLRAVGLIGRRGAAAPIDLALAPGQLLRVRGANGSGKSSLLRMLAGLLRPLAGGVQ